ncbi:hypothetical protein POKO110462_07570 [Pontibacter korlensis]
MLFNEACSCCISHTLSQAAASVARVTVELPSHLSPFTFKRDLFIHTFQAPHLLDTEIFS